MASEKINVKIEADYNDRDAKAAIKDAEKLDDLDPKIEIDADADQARAAIRDVTEELEDVPSAADKVAAAIVAMASKIDSESRDAASAADALRLALGEASSRIDASEAVAELQKMGLSADEVRADADKLAAALKQVDEVDQKRAVDGLDSVGDAARRADDDVKALGDSSDQSRSVMANLAGNAAQDLGEIGGVAGTAGVALGQLAEYATEGNISLRNLAGVAGPMLGILAGIEVAGNLMAYFGAESKRAAEETKTMVEALKEEGSVLAAANALLTETGALLTPDIDDSYLRELGEAFLGLGEGTNNLNDSLTASGITFGTWNRAVAGSAEEARAMVGILMDAADAGKITTDQEKELVAALYSSRTAWSDAAASVEQFNTLTTSTAADANTALQALNETQGHLTDSWSAVTSDIEKNGQVTDASITSWNHLRTELQLTDAQLADIADQKIADELAKQEAAAAAAAEKYAALAVEAVEMAEATREATAIMRSAEWGAAGIEGATAAYDKYRELVTGDRQRVADSQDAWDGLGESIDTAGDSLLDLQSPEGRQVFSALDELGTSIVPDLAKAFDESDGDINVFRRSVDTLSRQTLTRLQNEFGVSEEDARAMIAELGLLPEQVETFYKLAGDEEAIIKIGLLQGVINTLPESTQTEIAMAIIADDPQAALNAAQREINRKADLTAQMKVGAAVDWAAINAALAAVNRRVRETYGKVTIGAQVAGQSAGRSAEGSSVSTTVYVNVPHGTRPDDIVRAGDRYARRNGSSHAYR